MRIERAVIAVLIVGMAASVALFAFGKDSYGKAADPHGPQLAFTEWSLRPRALRLVTLNRSGAGVHVLAEGVKPGSGGPVPFEGPSFSPDGRELAYVAHTGAHARSIVVIPAEGGPFQAVPRTRGASHPVFSVDGKAIAFSRSRTGGAPSGLPGQLPPVSVAASASIWLVEIATGRQEQITPWEPGVVDVPASFSPDGAYLSATKITRGRPAAVVIDLHTGLVRRLASAAQEPMFSQDGAHIALISYRDHDRDIEGGEVHVSSELYSMNIDGSGLERLTRSEGLRETSPAWDPSGRRLAYTQTTAGEPLGFGLTNVVMEMNVNGTCAQRIYGSGASAGPGPGLYGPVWRPGPGRAAASIVCG
jgi:Tol biopolymer transport system component